ncbi:MAG: ribonuclease HII [Chloroflexi bacterium AL-W]|nr:ribonuclease HII [Chloroflexi bacterium AL-N1]NOK70213.1 ribonuclease HII [Chloroflexi bacterium AL-N10]NOK77750.1 ribonuclease HII [Chloroflexi bacterium AL-N5]NOK84759.1 ribonuclease HII [Chloroflexi bacterium AL-W]NOK93178.1 ribonuclease HII [Chloroflexi bacterium AL-N15]
MSPDVIEELSLYKDGCHVIAGLDEAGRGCWAGPVVAAAVVLPLVVLHKPHLLSGVNDSKQVNQTRRAKLYQDIMCLAVGWGVGVVPSHVIDTHGIIAATHLAMQIAILKLPQLPDALLIDAVTLKNWPCTQRSFVRGDARCLSIAAASIIAKVTRDRLMVALWKAHPDYGFAQHKGYGTAVHYHALQRYGPSQHHRRTFRPLSEFLTNGIWPDRAR